MKTNALFLILAVLRTIYIYIVYINNTYPGLTPHSLLPEQLLATPVSCLAYYAILLVVSIISY